MKKIILTIGVLGLLCSCSTNQNINKIIELEEQYKQLKISKDSLEGEYFNAIEELQRCYNDCGNDS
jgi:hypothetical protein